MRANVNGYFGTHASLPPIRQLHAGKLSCLYENGNLRYIRVGSCEIIRLVYAAVRDQNWLTATHRIENETIEQGTESFRITYTSLHELGDIRYQMEVLIEGKADNSLVYKVKGEALSDFLRNRIGICIHHPISHFAGQSVKVTRPNGSWYQVTCPQLVNPHQPLLSVQSMEWSPMEGLTARLDFSGETFETEDQRNWSDASFKTYSTPLILPHPIAVQAGDCIEQAIQLQVDSAITIDSTLEHVHIELLDTSYPFPKIGYTRSPQPLTDADIALLTQVPFDHYRVEIHFSHNWQEVLKTALAEARQLNTKLELVCFFGEEVLPEVDALLVALQSHTEHIANMMLLASDQAIIPHKRLEKITHKLKGFLPTEKVGTGTNEFFAELNRSREFSEDVGFLSYSLNPQVHLSDTRVLIENLEAQHHTLQTALSFANGKAIHVSPVTLRIRNYPEANRYTGTLPSNVDTRQYSEFAAAWTLLSIKHLAQARQITYYETVGMRGIMQGAQPPEDPDVFQTQPGDVFPIYTYLKQLKSLQPRAIIPTTSSQPLVADALVVASAEGKQTAFVINFAEEPQTVHLAGNTYSLSPASITQLDL